MAAAGVPAPAITPEMLSYCRLRYAMIAAGLLYTILTYFILLHSGAAAYLRNITSRWTKYKFIHVLGFFFVFALAFVVIRLPYSYFAGYQIDHLFGLSHQSLSNWFTDLLKLKAVDAGIAAFAFAVAFAIIDRFPKRWPFVLWAVLVPLIATGIFLAPLIIDPLVNKFTEMQPGPLRADIQQVAAKAGIPNAPVFVVDKSRQTTKLNAYVTGLGSSARIVIWDTTVQKLPNEQVQAIVAHEAGHYVLGHIVLGFSLISVALLGLLLLAQRLQPRILSAFPKRWGITGFTDPAIIPAALLIGSIGATLVAPIENGISRAMEHQADAFGLQVTGNGPAMARAFVSLSQQNLSEPSPPAFIQFWFFSHPSLKERILFALGK